jgi:hypothetical protein
MTPSPQTAEPQVPQCPICHLPLGPIEINLNRRWHFDCQVCTICKQQISPDIIEKSITDGRAIAHPVCSEVQTIAELKTHKIPATIAYLESVNNEILILKHDMNPTTGDISLISEMLTKMQETCANVSWMLKLERDKISIQASQEYSDKVKAERKVKAAQSQKAAIEDAEKQAKQALRKLEKENPALKAYNETIKSLRGLYGDKAEEMAAAMGIVKPQMPSGE